MSEISKKKSKAKKASKKKATQAKKRVAKTTGKSRATSKKKKKLSSVSAEQRMQMVREAAYFRAMNRGFQGGSSEQDWLEAEMQIAQQLQD